LSALTELDMVLVLNRGSLLEFGPRDEVWARLARRMGKGVPRSVEGAQSHRSAVAEGKLA
jgi:ABC-type protease/lipase transport system fused ATPase/permease subunit